VSTIDKVNENFKVLFTPITNFMIQTNKQTNNKQTNKQTNSVTLRQWYLRVYGGLDKYWEKKSTRNFGGEN
jgi:hypothetical protein